jgi:hypothetical protein
MLPACMQLANSRSVPLPYGDSGHHMTQMITNGKTWQLGAQLQQLPA